MPLDNAKRGGNLEVARELYFPIFDDDRLSVRREQDFLNELGVSVEIFDSVEDYIDQLESFSEGGEDRILLGSAVDINIPDLDVLTLPDGTKVPTEKGRTAGLLVMERLLAPSVKDGSIPRRPFIYLSANPDDITVKSARSFRSDLDVYVCRKLGVDGNQQDEAIAKYLTDFREIATGLVGSVRAQPLRLKAEFPNNLTLAECKQTLIELGRFLDLSEEELINVLGTGGITLSIESFFDGKDRPTRDWFERIALLFEFKAVALDLIGSRQGVLEWLRHGTLFEGGHAPIEGLISGPVENMRAVIRYLRDEY